MEEGQKQMLQQDEEGGEKEETSNTGLPAKLVPVQGVPWWGGGSNPGGSVRPFTIVPSHTALQQGTSDETQPQTGAPVVHSNVSEYALPHAQFEQSMASAGYQYVDPYYGGVIATYGGQAMFHPHMLGLHHSRMPLPYGITEEEPVYVNAKQYKRIMMRRQCRAKAESENKLAKSRKPYLHESRHLHAIRRARGCGGRFLNKKDDTLNTNSDSSRSEDQSSQGGATPDSKRADQGFNTCALQMFEVGNHR